MDELMSRLGTLYRYRLLDFLGLWSKVKATDDVLDVGGFDGYSLSRLLCQSKTLIDPNAVETSIDIEYLKTGFLDHDFAGRQFDVILSLDVMEHLPSGTERDFLRKIAVLLKSGGEAWLTVPSESIRVTPDFLTAWVSHKWGHEKCLGYTPGQLSAWLPTDLVHGEIREVNAPTFRGCYFVIRILQCVVPGFLLRYVVGQIARYDSRYMKGIEGYYLVELRKS